MTAGARIAAKAGGGEILVASLVLEPAAGRGFLFADHGVVEPQGFQDPLGLYEVRWSEDA